MSHYYSLQVRNPRSYENLDGPYSDLLDFQIRFIRKCWTAEGHQRILDIGSAEGFFLKRLADECKQSASLEGVEPGQAYSAAARQLLPDAVIHEMILESADLPEDSFDLITIRHVLEHLLDPVSAVKLLRPLLKKSSGILHIEVPDVTEIPATICPFLHHEHVNSFTPATLRFTLERAGFRILKHESADDNPIGSGFAYPVQRILATPAEQEDWRAGISRDAGEDGKRLYNDYNRRYHQFLSGQMEFVRRRVSELMEEGKKIGVFGAGPHTFEMFRALDLNPSDFLLALDNNIHKQGKHIRGIEIRKPTQDVVALLDAVLVSSAEFESLMVEELIGLDIPDLEIMCLYTQNGSID